LNHQDTKAPRRGDFFCSFGKIKIRPRIFFARVTFNVFFLLVPWCLGGSFFFFNASAADWPQWRGPLRDGHVPPGVAVPTKLSDDPKIVWRKPIEDGWASPVVADRKVFYLDNQDGRETVHAIGESDAKELWRADLDKSFHDGQTPAGPRCTPLVDGDRVYVQSCRGELKCLKTTDGSALWSVNYTKDFSAKFIGEVGTAQGAGRHGYAGAPLIDGDRLYASVGGTNGEGVVCFDKKTGRVIWKSQNDLAAYAAPIAAKVNDVKQLVDFVADGAIGLDLNDGKFLWRVPIKTSSARHVTTPVVDGDMVSVSSHEVGLIGIKVSQENGNWQAKRAWVNKSAAINFSSPVLVDGFLYGLGLQKNLECVELKTGRQMWSQTGYINTAGGVAHAAFIVMGKNILALTDGGQLVLFAVDPKAFKEIGKAQVCGKTWCNPAYADGKLFLRDTKDLICVELVR